MTSSSMTSSSVAASIVTASTLSPVSTPLHEKDGSADCGPMSRQDVFDAHGYDMHPQKLVRLVGCHESGAEAIKHPARVLK